MLLLARMVLAANMGRFSTIWKLRTVNLTIALLLTAVSILAEQLPVKTYTIADGLARDFINKIKQDPRGFLWFCTAEGISRFDGYDFVNYGVADGLPHRVVNDLLIKQDGKILNQISCQKIFCIFAIWDFTFSTKIIDELLKYQISVYVLSHNLKPKFLIWWSLEWNYLLRQKQYLATQEFTIAKHIVNNKTNNQLTLLKNIRTKDSDLKGSIQKIELLIQKIEFCENDDSLRWIEWNISKINANDGFTLCIWLRFDWFLSSHLQWYDGIGFIIFCYSITI